MNRLFNPDNPFMQFISSIFDLVILNLIFILSCIPIFTIGASLSALYYVCLKMLRGEEPYIWQNYWKAFRKNFRQSTLLWILAIVAFVILGMDFYIINSRDTLAFAVIRVALWLVCLVLVCIFLYLFPVISHFVCTTKQALKNAALMAIAHLPYTLILLAIHGLILFLASCTPKTLALVVVLSGICGFSVVAFTCCILFDRIFRTYEPQEDSHDIG
ncbi:MAG: DUF624 domain-containing protein [Hespellia sp.]|nr:DUF624 domain-containing protein [Hespellia sp.]